MSDGQREYYGVDREPIETDTAKIARLPAVRPELAALAALGAKHREIAELRTLYEEQLDHCAGVIAKQDGLIEAMRAKCEEIARTMFNEGTEGAPFGRIIAMRIAALKAKP